MIARNQHISEVTTHVIAEKWEHELLNAPVEALNESMSGCQVCHAWATFSHSLGPIALPTAQYLLW